MKKSRKKTSAMLSLVAEQTSDLRILQDVRRMKKRLGAKSMARILKRVPGGTVVDKCRVLGVTRTTYYSWVQGITRPRGKEILANLAKVTGIDVDEIRGA